jgi:hypothetical protein
MSNFFISVSKQLNENPSCKKIIDICHVLVKLTTTDRWSGFLGIQCIFKYSDDSDLLVSKNTDVQLYDEFLTIQRRTVSNKMIINISKTTDIVFHHPNPPQEIPLCHCQK